MIMLKIILTLLILFPVYALADSTLIEDDEFQVTYIDKYAATTQFDTDTDANSSSSEDPNDYQIPLFYPDLDSIPAGSNIDSVYLKLLPVYCDQEYLVELWEITSVTWVETVACYDSSTTGKGWYRDSNWDPDNLGVADTSETGRTGAYDIIEVTSGDGDGLCESYQSQLDGDSHGQAMYINTTSTITCDIYSEDHATASYHPEATVFYTPPAGGGDSSRRRRSLNNRIIGEYENENSFEDIYICDNPVDYFFNGS